MCQGKKKVIVEDLKNTASLTEPYIEVGVAIPVFGTYTYHVPASQMPFVLPGKRVLVPFRQRKVTGYVLGPSSALPGKKIKSVLDVLDETPLFPAEMAGFFKWVADYYIHPVGEVIRAALPRGLTLYEMRFFSLTEKGRGAETDRMSPLEKIVLKKLVEGPCSLKEITRWVNQDVPYSLCHSLVSRGLVAMKKEVMGGGVGKRFAAYVALVDGASGDFRMTPKRKQLIETLQVLGETSVETLNTRIPNVRRILPGLVTAGIIEIRKKPVYRDPFGDAIAPDVPPELTQEQSLAVSTVLESVGQGYQAFLLTGVTGSGKTEVYLQVAAAAIQRGVSVLVLVPEIGLISQTERRFRARFGEIVAVLHSGLTAGERYDQWRRISENNVRIAVGARSAVFAPFQDLGLIIVDEEHDISYKQENGLRYNARDLAVMRAKKLGSVVLLGSATPSVQSYFNMTAGKFVPLSLSKRVMNRSLPHIDIVDLKALKGHRGIQRFMTPELQAAIRDALGRGEQTLLFLNRRGFANFPVCKTCGDPICCKNCDISLTLHHGENAYKCHFCGFSQPASSLCPTCGSDHIQLLGMGTEKVELAIKRLFPNARVARMDRDTTRRKGATLKLLKAVKESRIDILVGTQMLAKGHDFPNITLVGIICADLSLSFPDFRAGERTYQLLAQVSGRAGRGERPGRVVLQTYNPSHFSILCAKEQNYDSFYKHEIGFRQALQYPPYTRLIQLRVSGKDKRLTREITQSLGDGCTRLKTNAPDAFGTIEVLGPIESPLQRVAGRYRWQLLLKGAGAGPLHRFVRRLIVNDRALFSHRHVKIQVDVDPFYML